MILGIYSLPLRGAGGGEPPGSGNYLTLGTDRLRLGADYLVLTFGPLPEPMAALVDAIGEWEWAAPGAYGLSDDGAGSWVWSDAPSYLLDPYQLDWRLA